MNWLSLSYIEHEYILPKFVGINEVEGPEYFDLCSTKSWFIIETNLTQRGIQEMIQVSFGKIRMNSS